MLRFSKMEGCGNDFVVVDVRSAAETEAVLAQPDIARHVCDRRRGIGADGILIVAAATSAAAAARMRVINADGSEAEMCGNGIRCVANYLTARDLRPGPWNIETGAGVQRCEPLEGGQGEVVVHMGRPRLLRGEIPMQGPAGERALEQPMTIAARRWLVTAVSLGNPHAVVFDEGPEPLEQLARTYGPQLEREPAFPLRTNAEFARMRGVNEIELVVWERGCGITLACGTGACATAVAACLTGRARAGHELMIHLLGGTLGITVASDLSDVRMRGPGREVYQGTLAVEKLIEPGERWR